MQNSFDVNYGVSYVRTSSVLEVLVKELGCESSSQIGGKAFLFRKSSNPEQIETDYIVDLKEGAPPGYKRCEIGRKYKITAVSPNERLSDKKIERIIRELLGITVIDSYSAPSF